MVVTFASSKLKSPAAPSCKVVQLDNLYIDLYHKIMNTISTNEFRNKLADYLDDVSKNEISLVISRFGKPLAKVIPLAEEDSDIDKYFGFLKDSGESGTAFENRIRRNKKER